MKIITKIQEARNFVDGKKIILIPTMGALHDGHISLINKAIEYADINSQILVSILVNKLQFESRDDLNNYPSDHNKDIEVLSNSEVDCVYLADNKEIYPDDFDCSVVADNSLVNVMEGINRQKHFNGVATIICKIFNILTPTIAVFGEKDFQQYKIISKLVDDLNFNTKVVVSKTIREESGLAMSSRNTLLSDNEKLIAKNIYKILKQAKDEFTSGAKGIDLICQESITSLLSCGFNAVDYFEFRCDKNLSLITKNTKFKARIYTAARLGSVRLIDNIKL